MMGLTLIVNVGVLAHCPEVGVKVYVVVAWLFNEGLHVPVIPFNDELGNAARTSP
jgi:hypothetical protein